LNKTFHPEPTLSPADVDMLLRTVMVLGGCAMGIFYGFDGWRGSIKDLGLRNSPRVKNLLWVLGAGAGIFIADFKAVDKSADRGVLLLIYAIGFFAAAFLTVVSWGCIIGVKFFKLRRSQPQNMPPEPFSPVLDYFYYGYAFHRSQYEAALASNREDRFKRYRNYVQIYVEQISLAIAAVDNPATTQNATTIIRDILRSIQSIVIAYHKKESALEINVNYMEAIAAEKLTESDWGKILFYDQASKSRYEYFLALREYASDQEREDFILPVERRNTPEAARVLPGAPEAFMKLRYVAIDDTSKINYPSELPREIANQMKSYFKSKAFKSFGAVPVIGNGQPLGVVNVDSTEVEVFGNSEQEQREIATLLSPFCLLLGKIVSR
jgi:hypothetical protein